MIPVEDVRQDEATGGSKIEVKVDPLNDDEQFIYDELDAQLDAIAADFRGDMFSVSVAQDSVSDRVLSAIKSAWEIGGWIVGVFPVDGGRRLVLARSRGSVSSTKLIKSIDKRDEQPRNFNAPGRQSESIEDFTRRRGDPVTRQPLLVRMPTRGRPQQALRALEQYRLLARTAPVIEVVVDADDDTMLAAPVLQRLQELDCVVTVGNHRSKIDAVNGGQVDDWQVLLLASDDMWPVKEGYDERILEEMQRHFPLLDGALNFNDGYNRDHVREGRPILNTLPIMGRHLWEQFGYVYHPEYGSLYCDDEYTELLTQMRRLVFIDEVLIEHRHHAAGKAAHDALYQYNDNRWGAHDRSLFETRAQGRAPGAQFAFNAPPLDLSILICTVPERKKMFDRLVAHLRRQMRELPRFVEICSDDRLGITVGEKRQALLERAVGHYVAFIDDDDWVPHDYVRRMVGAVGGRPDCVSLVGALVTGGKVERFDHSMKHSGWYTKDGQHFRYPNHLNAVKRELALRVGFKNKNVGEDHDFSRALRPLLAIEASTGTDPLYYYFYQPERSVQRSNK